MKARENVSESGHDHGLDPAGQISLSGKPKLSFCQEASLAKGTRVEEKDHGLLLLAQRRRH
jgi:hypothetical protein